MLADAGFDIVQRFDIAIVPDDPAYAMLEHADPARRVGVLIGNSRVLWPAFLAARAADPVLAAASDPIERYTEDAVSRAFPGERVWFSHRRYDGAFVPFQRLAQLAGLGALAPTGLVIHPRFGPWFALRAVVITAGEPPPRVEVAPYRCTGACEARLAEALASGGDWRAWLAVREACTVGRDERYSDDQIAYHYTKNRGLLR